MAIESRRLITYDAIRVFSILSVVACHTTDMLWEGVYPGLSWKWAFLNSTQTFMRTCIPIFFMLSGALLLTGKNVFRPFSFYSHRLKRIGIPFLMYSLFYYFYKHGMNGNFNQFIREFLFGGTYYHLWFIYPLMTLYIAAPVIALFIQNLSKEQFEKALILLFTLNCIQYYIQTLFPDYQIGFSFSFISGWTVYFICGAWIARYRPELSLRTLLLWLIPAYCITYVHRYFFTVDIYYFSLNMVILSIAVFLLFERAFMNAKPSPILAYLSEKSFGIYLTHLFFLTQCTPLVSRFINGEKHYIVYSLILFTLVIGFALLWEWFLDQIYSRVQSFIAR